MNRRTTFTLCLLMMSTVILGQEKRIHKKVVPEAITKYISVNYPQSTRVRYFEEKEVGKVFIESEFQFEDQKFILKFENNLLIEEEVLLPFEELPENVQVAISKELNTAFGKYKILECQEVNPYTDLLYEIEVRSKSKKQKGVYELCFTKEGVLTEKKEVVIRSIPSQF